MKHIKKYNKDVIKKSIKYITKHVINLYYHILLYHTTTNRYYTIPHYTMPHSCNATLPQYHTATNSITTRYLYFRRNISNISSPIMHHEE